MRFETTLTAYSISIGTGELMEIIRYDDRNYHKEPTGYRNAKGSLGRKLARIPGVENVDYSMGDDAISLTIDGHADSGATRNRIRMLIRTHLKKAQAWEKNRPSPL